MGNSILPTCAFDQASTVLQLRPMTVDQAITVNKSVIHYC